MPFRQLTGHRHLFDLIARAATRGTLPPSVIFAGPEGVGKRLAAVALAQLMNCLTPVLQAGGEPNLVEAIAGLLDEDDPETCARREAMEEAGLRLTALEPVGVIWTSPGYSTERISLFLAPYTAADRVAEGGGLAEESEDIEVLEVGFSDLVDLLERGDITDLKTVTLAQALRIRCPDLFGKT